MADALPPTNNNNGDEEATFTSHTDAIYAITSHYDAQSNTLYIVSGGGDDRAYLHLMTTSNNQAQTKTIPLAHPHTDSISCVALNTPYITNDVSGTTQANQIAVGSYDGSIVLYSTTDGTLLHVFEGPTDVEWARFHPKGGTVLLVGSIADGTIWMYHTPSKQCLQVFVGHEGGVTDGVFTMDGKSIVSCGQDGTVRVWAPKKGVCKHVFRLMDVKGSGGGEEEGGGGGGGGGLTCLAVGGGQDGQLAICGVGFCPGNIPGTAHWCATGGVDGVLKVWNMNVGGVGGAQLRQKCTRGADVKAGITRLRWHNSLPLVIASYTDGVVCIWDARVGTVVGTFTGHEDMINDMDVSFVDGSNAAVIVTGSDDKSVKIKATFTSHTDAIYAITSHYDAQSNTLYIVSGGGDDRAYLHLMTTSNNQAQTKTVPLAHPHTDSISCVALNTPYITNDVSGTTQANQIAVGSYDGSIVLYSTTDGTLLHVFEGPTDVEWARFHPKGGTVLLVGSIADGTIWMYHTPSKQCLQVFVGHEGGVTDGVFTMDGKAIVSCGQDGTVRVWAPKKGVCKHVFRLMDVNGSGGEEEGGGGGLTCLAVGGGQDGQLAICGVGFCPGNIPGTAHWCATGGVDGVLKVWNMNVGGVGGAQLRQKCTRGADVKAGITRLRWHNSLPLVIASYTDGVVCIWDARVGTVVGTFTGHEDMINDMDVSFVDGSNAAVIVTGSDDKSVKMFEFHP
ncbi:WD40 repeat domain-containing protein [Skeletonema marinoi]|uniref:WD40 repeat domain-containing protein n=1 Tax=Skeletonema marinoi TaxID=267567 RepID=A0AAD9DGX2_9STRA|nr:WD40 repeat domain-containing protein [Skeletonema marinoi]